MFDIETFRGRHSVVIAVPSLEIVFKIFPISLRSNALKEKEALSFLNREKFPCAPRLYGYVETDKSAIIIKEFITGIYFHNFFLESKISDLREVLLKILNCLHLLDKFNIFIDEMDSPRRNIVIRENQPFFIDLERWSRSTIQSNVTQFLGFLLKAHKTGGEIGNRVNTIFHVDKIMESAKEYKKKRDINVVSQIFK